MRKYISVAAVMVLAGCHSLEAERKEKPLSLQITPHLADTRAIADGCPRQPCTKDLGEVLFWKITESSEVPVLAITASWALRPLPGPDDWVSRWTYTGPDATGADIFTNPQLYDGAIGVIVGQDGQVKTRYPLIQVDGVKKGRRWGVAGGPEFIRYNRLVRSWALRYGGEREGGHRFAIVNFENDKEKDIVQDFLVSNEEGSTGFSVKGVTVSILSFGGGRITYSFHET